MTSAIVHYYSETYNVSKSKNMFTKKINRNLSNLTARKQERKPPTHIHAHTQNAHKRQHQNSDFTFLLNSFWTKQLL